MLSRRWLGPAVFSRLLAPQRAPATLRWASSASEYTQNQTRPRGEPIREQDAALAPGLQTLAARLRLQDIPPAELARTLVSDTSTLKFANNAGLAKFGRTLLSFYLYEHFIAKYPRLPAPVLKHVVDVYTSINSLSELGGLWGVQSDTRGPLARHLAAVPDEQALGRLAYTEKIVQVEAGVAEVRGSRTMTPGIAMGTFVRALVAAVYAHRGLDGTREFVHDFLIRPRQLDVRAVLAFSRPTRELAVLCAREGLEAPVSRLMAESGRYSLTPVFVVGVFSGEHKLGEGQGSSLREARTRAAVNALQAWYLYSPVGAAGAGAAADGRPIPGAAPASADAVYIDPGQVVI